MFLLIACFIFTSTHAKYTSYTGAVVEYRPYNDWTHGPDNILKNNVKTIADFAVEAKFHGADIIVYPEYGLTGQNVGENFDDFLKVTQVVPEPNSQTVPCIEDKNDHTYRALQELSCVARDQQLYMVVGIAEWVPDKHSSANDVFHNTQVVFDRNGMICARSRKKSLYFEKEFTPGVNISETALFTTDFGVKFSLMTSFDIMYAEPGLINVMQYGATDVLISAFWIDGLPFLTAPQIFSAWAEGLGVNVLISNYHVREKGGTGFGIFAGKTNISNTYVYEPNLVSGLIIKNISTEIDYLNEPEYMDTPNDMFVDPLSDIIIKTNNLSEMKAQVFVHENLSNYSSVVLNSTLEWAELEHCYENVCCSLNYTMDETTNKTYHLIAFDGIVGRGEGVYKMYVQVCSVVYCDNSDTMSCSNVTTGASNQSGLLFLHELKGTFQTEFVYPSVLLSSLRLMDTESWSYTRNINSKYSNSLKTEWEEGNILSATLYGRYYERDPL